MTDRERRHQGWMSVAVCADAAVFPRPRSVVGYSGNRDALQVSSARAASGVTVSGSAELGKGVGDSQHRKHRDNVHGQCSRVRVCGRTCYKFYRREDETGAAVCTSTPPVHSRGPCACCYYCSGATTARRRASFLKASTSFRQRAGTHRCTAGSPLPARGCTAGVRPRRRLCTTATTKVPTTRTNLRRQ